MLPDQKNCGPPSSVLIRADEVRRTKREPFAWILSAMGMVLIASGALVIAGFAFGWGVRPATLFFVVSMAVLAVATIGVAAR